MNKIIPLIFYITLLCNPLLAQVTCKGKIVNLPPNLTPKLAVEYWIDERWENLDTLRLNADQSFQIKLSGNAVEARLKIWGQPTHWIEFLIPQNLHKDTLLDFGAVDYNQMNMGAAKLPGKENDAYYMLLTDAKHFKELRDSVAKIDSPDVATTALLATRMEKENKLLNDHCNEINRNLKGTFTGEIVANLVYLPMKSDYNDKQIHKLSTQEFERQHLLDRIPFGDKRVLSHTGFTRALNNYMTKFSKTDSTDQKLFIDRVMNKRKGINEVDAWIFHFLLMKFVTSRDDVSLTYLIKSYSEDCADEENGSDKSTSMLLTALKNCQVGSKAFNLLLPDTNGKNISISDVAAKSKITVLFIWRTTCSHCREFEPQLEKMYEKYKPQGLEVIGIALDNNESEWRKYLTNNPMSWVNLHIVTSEQRSQVGSNFPIPGTPSLVIVDKNLIVQNRLMVRSSLEKYLEQALLK